MPISQIAAVDASIIQFAATHSVETIPNSGSSFSAYLARIMDPQQADRSPPGYWPDGSQPDATERSSANDSAIAANRTVQDEAQTGTESATHAGKGPETGRAPEGRDRAADPVKERKQDSARTDAPRKDPAPKDAEKTAAGTEGTAGAKHTSGSDDARVAELRGAKAAAASTAAGNALTDLKPRHADPVPVTDTGRVAADGLSAQTSGLAAEADRTTEKAALATTDEGHAVASRKVEITVAPVLRGGKSGPAEASPSTVDGAHKGRKSVLGVEKSDRGQAQDDGPAPHGGKGPRLVIHDLRGRQGSADQKPSHDASQTRAETALRTDTADAPQRSESGESASTFHNVLRGSDSAPAGARAPGAPAPLASGTQQALRRTLSESVNGEIVKAARMVVRGNDTGEIRLHLKPETLGNVRILLQMQEGHIAGRIIVENSSVRDVFEQNLASLLRAFNESGISTGDVDVMLADSGSGDQAHEESRPAPRAVGELDRAVPLVQTLDDRHELVDLVV